MIKKDLRYIIKRIIIGVGIVIVLSCLNGCKVKALAPNVSGLELITNVYFDSNCNRLDSVHSPGIHRSYGIYYKSSNDRYYFGFASDDNGSANISPYYLSHASRVPYISILCYNPSGSTNEVKFNFTASPVFYNATEFMNGYSIYPGASYVKQNGYSAYASIKFTNIFSVNGNNSYSDTTATYTVSYNNEFNQNLALVNANTNRKLAYTNYTTRDLTTNTIFFDRNIEWNPQEPDITNTSSFVSFNAIPITTKDVITSYTIQPEFTNFNTDSYIYQYSFDKKRWLSLTENKKLLRINNNSSIYVRVKDKNTNDIIDSANLTITNIGTFYDNQTYNINFSGDYRTQNYLDDNMCVFEGSKSDIKEYQIYIDYLPKSSILKYQYQYVPTDSQLDSNNWQNVPSTDNGSMTYVATENGTLYARILDKEDNVLKISTFKISSIGKIAIDDIDKKCTKNIFQKFSSEINYGGPVSVLFKIPVDLLSSLYNTASTSNTCHPYVISKLMDTNFVLPCFNLENKFGSTIYREIDAMLCFILSIMFFKFLLKIYNDFISMKDIN